MTTSPCICIFTGYFHPHFGGVERFTANFARHLSRKGYRLMIVTLNSENVIDEEIVDNIKIIRLPVLGLFKGRYPLINIFKERCWQQIRYLKNEKIDHFILNTRFYTSTFFGLWLAVKKGKNCLIIEHATGHLITNNPLINIIAELYEHQLTRFVKKSDPSFFGVSKACVQWLKHFNIIAQGVIYNGIDEVTIDAGNNYFRSKFRIPADHLVISTASRLIPEKGVLEVLDAFEKFGRIYESSHFFLAGDGDLFEFLLKKYSNHPRIHILGRLDYKDIMILFNESDIVINPSRYPEGLPTVILEAGMAKCAVIATDKGGSSEIIPDRNYGIILSCNDSDCFTKAIYELYENDELRTNMALNLQNRVKECFNWDRIVDNFLLTLRGSS